MRTSLLVQMRRRRPQLQVSFKTSGHTRGLSYKAIVFGSCHSRYTPPAEGGSRLFLPTPPRLCYNLRAVERSVRSLQLDANRSPLSEDTDERQCAVEHPINFCPVCSERLEAARCKLVCRKC